MSDPADLGSEAEMVHLSDALCRQAAKPLPADGRCLYCGQQTPGRHFCDSDHRDEYQWLADAAKRAGQPIEALLPERDGEARKPFAKLFETDEVGQIVVVRRPGDDGPEVVISFDAGVVGIGVCDLTLSFDNDLMADKAFALTQERGALNVVLSQLDRIRGCVGGVAS